MQVQATDWQAKIADAEKRHKELQAYKTVTDETEAAKVAKETERPIEPADLQAAEVKATDPERASIDSMVSKLFSSSGGERTQAYTALTHQLRTKGYAVERILKLGNDTLQEPNESDFIGLYHTVVTLTDMSRAITQHRDYKDQILKYADAVAQAFPRLQRRVTILKDRVLSERR